VQPDVQPHSLKILNNQLMLSVVKPGQSRKNLQSIDIATFTHITIFRSIVVARGTIFMRLPCGEAV